MITQLAIEFVVRPLGILLAHIVTVLASRRDRFVGRESVLERSSNRLDGQWSMLPLAFLWPFAH